MEGLVCMSGIIIVLTEKAYLSLRSRGYHLYCHKGDCRECLQVGDVVVSEYVYGYSHARKYFHLECWKELNKIPPKRMDF